MPDGENTLCPFSIALLGWQTPVAADAIDETQQGNAAAESRARKCASLHFLHLPDVMASSVERLAARRALDALESD